MLCLSSYCPVLPSFGTGCFPGYRPVIFDDRRWNIPTRSIRLLDKIMLLPGRQARPWYRPEKTGFEYYVNKFLVFGHESEYPIWLSSDFFHWILCLWSSKMVFFLLIPSLPAWPVFFFLALEIQNRRTSRMSVRRTAVTGLCLTTSRKGSLTPELSTEPSCHYFTGNYIIVRILLTFL